MRKGIFKIKKQRVYLDYAAATPVDVEVMSAMRPYFSDAFGNPSAIHTEGVRAKKAVEEVREKLARTLRVRASGITFTGSGTEANNLGLFGVVRNLREKGMSFSEMEIISTKTEHPSLAEGLKECEALGISVQYAPLHEDGKINANAFSKLFSAKTVLVMFSYVNSEIGTVQDVKRLTRIVRQYNDAGQKNIMVHLDACQAPLWLPCDLDQLGVDLMSLDAGKCYGPKGAGVLARKHGVSLCNMFFGGGQEAGLRPGTENVPLIIGCAHAIIRAQEKWDVQSAHTAVLRDYMFERIKSDIKEAIVNGSIEDRVANNVNISIPGIDSEYAVVYLDTKGVAASTKSACSGAGGGGSVVVREITGDEKRAQSTIRFTLGKETQKKDIDYTLSVLKSHLTMMQKYKTETDKN